MKPISPWHQASQVSSIALPIAPPTLLHKPRRPGKERPILSSLIIFRPPPRAGPTTKEVTILFQGWFESSQEQLQAFVSLDGKKAKGGVKDAIGENLTIEAIEAGQLIVKSADEIQHTIPFKKPTKITIPLP